MKLEVADVHDLKPVIHAAVVAVLEELQAKAGPLGDRLAFPEAEAAALLGVAPHVLRDCRLRGEIAGRLVGKKIVYSRDSLLRFLAGDSSRHG